LYLLALSHFRSGPRSLRAYHLLKERHLRTPKAKYLLAKCCLDLSKYSEAESVLTSDFFSNSSSRTSNSTNLTNSAQGQTNPNGQQQQQQQQHQQPQASPMPLSSKQKLYDEIIREYGSEYSSYVLQILANVYS